MKKFIVLIVLSILIVGMPLWAVQYHGPLKKVVGNFGIAKSTYSVSLSPMSALGVYYTFSPLDDILILADGSERKVMPSLDEDNSGVNPFYGRGLALWHDFTWIITRNVEYVFESKESAVSVGYRIKLLDESTIQLERGIDLGDLSVVGIGRSLLFNPSDQVFFNSVLVDRPTNVDQTQLVVMQGINKITWQNPQMPGLVELAVESGDQIVLDWRFNVLTVKHFLDQPQQDKLIDVQTFKL